VDITEAHELKTLNRQEKQDYQLIRTMLSLYDIGVDVECLSLDCSIFFERNKLKQKIQELTRAIAEIHVLFKL
jgi:hypothetical protein